MREAELGGGDSGFRVNNSRPRISRRRYTYGGRFWVLGGGGPSQSLLYIVLRSALVDLPRFVLYMPDG